MNVTFRWSRTIALSMLWVGLTYHAANAEPQPITQLPPQPGSTQSGNHAMSLTYRYETYYSDALAEQRTYGISLPPDYDQHPDRHYPVIFLLHGGHGDQTDWWQVDKGDALTTIQQLYQQGKLPPSIIVTPDGNDKRGSSADWDPEYFDGPNGNMSTAIGDELVRLIQTRYRTLPPPDFWAIGGLSSGGWGAVNVGLHHLDHFSVLFSHSGYFEDDSGTDNSPIDVIKTLPDADLKRLRIYLDSGESDTEFLSQSEDFQQVLNQLGVVNLFHAYPGSHSWRYWRDHLTDSLTFVGEQFQLFALSHSADYLNSLDSPFSNQE